MIGGGYSTSNVEITEADIPLIVNRSFRDILKEPRVKSSTDCKSVEVFLGRFYVKILEKRKETFVRVHDNV